jgi:hypothetical protein
MDRERDGILPSDHFAVLAVLRLKAGRADHDARRPDESLRPVDPS